MKLNLTKNAFKSRTFVLGLLSLYCLVFFSISSCKKSKGTGGPPQNSGDLAINAISPLKGPGLTELTIEGSGFSTTTTGNIVTINGKEALVAEATATKLIVLVPMGAGTGPVKVQVGSNTVTGPNFEYEWVLVVNTLAGDEPGFADGTGRNAQFMLPRSITVAADGSLYVTDENNFRIRKVTPEGVVTTFTGSREGHVDGPLAVARFGFPSSVVAGPGGVLYVGDGTSIRKITPDGMVSTFVGGLTTGYVDGQGTTARFSMPNGLCIDAQGNLYCLDGGFGTAVSFTPAGTGIACGVCIRKITPAGVVSTLAGSIAAGPKSGLFDYADGPGTAARFSSLTNCMTIDAQGNLFVAEEQNNCIRKITPGGMVSTYAGVKGERTIKNGILAEARFAYPGVMTADAKGNVYVSELGVIRKISTGGVVSTYAGNGIPDTHIDAPVMTAGLGGISGMVFSQDGSILYFCDKLAAGNHLTTIRRVMLQ